MNNLSSINKIIKNQIHNNHVAESFFMGLSNLGLEAQNIERRFRFDIHPICEFFSIPSGDHLGKEGKLHPLNWEIVESCSVLMGFLYPESHMENVISFLQNLQKIFTERKPSKKDQPALISNEFFDMFSSDELTQRIALSQSPMIANMYRNDIASYRRPNLVTRY